MNNTASLLEEYSSADGEAFHPSPKVRIADCGGDLVVLDLRSGQYLSFSDSAAWIWKRLAEGRTREEIIALLQERFDLPRERAREDVERFLGRLEGEGLIQSKRPDRPDRPDRPVATPESRELGRRLFRVPQDRRQARGLRGLVHGAHAFLVLVYVDLLMRIFGMQRLYRLVTTADGKPARRRPEPEEIWHIVRAVDRAAAGYVKRVWCLQRSVACAVLLRRHGVEAQLVLGVVAIPFFAHAWVEIDGRPINEDNQNLLRELTVLDRV